MQLQKFPLGLTGALQLKVTGQAPFQFSDVLVPTIDVFDHYLAQGELILKNDSTAPALTQSFQRVFTVPQGKCWRVLAAGGFIVMNAADVALIAEGNVAVRLPNFAPFDCPCFTFTTPQLGTGARVFGTTFRPPLFLPSGMSMVVSMNYSAVITVAGQAFASLTVQEFDQ